MLTIQYHDDFESVEQGWRGCTEHQTLFNSVDWCRAWWSTWGNAVGKQLNIISIYDGSEMVGVLPLYKARYPNSWGLPNNQWQIVGSHYPSGLTILSEYSDIAVRKGYGDQVTQALLEPLNKLGYATLVTPFIAPDSLLRQCLSGPIVKLSEGFGVRVGTQGEWSGYLSSLSKSTRLKTFNRRKLLESTGSVALVNQPVTSLNTFFEQLNSFHAARWGNPCFGELSQSFYQTLVGSLDKGDMLFRPVLSTLTVDESVISVLFNIEFHSVTYNIQAGFDQSFHPKLALGSLHLGYAIEEAFARQDIKHFDLLFGEGKNTFYKHNYLGNSGQLIPFSTQLAFDNYFSYCRYRLKRLIGR